MSESYSPKEILILDAAAEMIGEGHTTVGTLKISDIAARAGIGKGTVYEYFSSKDEILCKAVFRHVSMELDREWTDIYDKADFKTGIYHAMEYLLEQSDCLSVWNLRFLGLLDGSSMETVMNSIRELFQSKVLDMGAALLQRGAEEGLFPMPRSADLACHVFVQLFSGLSFMAQIGDKNHYARYMDQAYEMLIKTLQ